MINRLVTVFLLIIVSNSYSFGQKNIGRQTSDKKLSVLFIGNSLTYSNNLPEIVKKRAKDIGIKLKTNMVALPNYAIVDHWQDGRVQKLISKGSYDYVILQQGPSSQPDGRRMLIEDGKKYQSLCSKNNTKLCYLMVWPALEYYHTFNGVIKNYSDAARINNTILLPVGKVWKAHFDSTNDFQYYSSDGFHPSLAGSQKAADVIIQHLFVN